MKKLLAGAFLAFLGVSTLTSCSDDPNKITVAFVPSQDANVIAGQAKEIGNLLQEELKEKFPDIQFEFTTGTNYTAVTEGMLSGQIDVGFLTAQQYAQASIKNKGKITPILTSTRDDYQVLVDNTVDGKLDEAKAIEAMNSPEYLGQQATTSTNNYKSICIVRTEDYNNGLKSLSDLAGKTVLTQKSSSGAGYVYPSVKLAQTKDKYENGLKFVNGQPDASKGEIKAQETDGYPAAVKNLLNGNADAAWIFLDVRYANFYNNKDSEFYQNKAIFENTKVIGMTTGIYNDTISVRSSLEDEHPGLTAALQDAFIKLAAEQYEEKGSDSPFYKIYSHTGYMKAKDSDYDGEREVYLWKQENVDSKK